MTGRLSVRITGCQVIGLVVREGFGENGRYGLGERRVGGEWFEETGGGK